MNINFQTRGPVPSSVRVIVTHNGKMWRKAIGLSVSSWKQKAQKSGNVKIDEALRLIRTGLESELNDLSTEKDILRALARVYGGKWHDTPKGVSNAPKTPSFATFLTDWCDRDNGAKRQHRSCAKIVLEEMGKHIAWEDIDSAFYARLVKAFDRRGMRPNYQGVVIGRLKTCLNEAYALHYMPNADFRNWAKPHEETFAIALSQEEVDALWSADLDPKLSKVRDLFLIGVYTAARFSDYSRLTEDNIVDGRLSFVQEKTDTPVLIPCSPKVKTILKRNGGHAPVLSVQTFNKKIKEVCRLAGIDSVVQVPEGTLAHLGKKKGEKVYKWELCSSHTARRTGASLLYKSGVPVRVCRYLTGHTKDETFLKYIKIDREEAADILAENPFFHN